MELQNYPWINQLFEMLLLGNSPWSWLKAVLTFGAVYTVLLLLRRYIPRSMRLVVQKTGFHRFTTTAALIEGTSAIFILIIALYIGSLSLSLEARWAQLAKSITIAAVLLQLGWWTSNLVSRLLFYYRHLRGQDQDPASLTAFGVMSFIGRVAIWALILLLVLENLGIDVTALIAGLGVGGIAVALALQNVLGDLIASLSIVLDRPFQVGDFIIVGEHMGTVERIGVKTTRVRSLSGESLIFPNSDILGSRIRNYKTLQERRITFSIGVTYQTPLEKLQVIPALIRTAIEGQGETRFDRSHFKEYGSFALIFESVYYVLSPEHAVYLNKQQGINLEIFKRFQEEGIEFAYPTQTVFLSPTGGPAPTPSLG